MTHSYRQHVILDKLASQGTVSINDLARDLGVSAMTVHRDLDQLERAGQLRKVRGGAVAAEAPPPGTLCMACYAPIGPRTQVVLHLADGSQQRACCPHCGLMIIGKEPESVASFLVTDFLFGRIVNGRTASYLAEPAISVCCTPTILAFEATSDAQRFQAGFGGRCFDLDEALRFVQAKMHLE